MTKSQTPNTCAADKRDAARFRGGFNTLAEFRFRIVSAQKMKLRAG